LKLAFGRICSGGDCTISEKLAALCNEAGLTTVLNGIGDGFYAVDCDWRIILFNDEAAQHFRRTPQEVLGRNLWETFPRARETGLGQLFLRTMTSRETVRSETESVVFGGRWLAYRLFPLGDGIGVVFRDITDRRNAEAQSSSTGSRIRSPPCCRLPSRPFVVPVSIRRCRRNSLRASFH
jgi:PAS domain S-box-containing protein